MEHNYPDLMVDKKIMYVHGFGSSAATNTVKLLQALLPSATVIAEDIPLDPHEAMAMLKDMAEREQPDLIIGTSMGGMYTEMLRGFDRILVNPAFQMGETMSDHGMVGKQTFQNPRKDGVQDFIVTKAMVKEYKEITTHCFEDMSDDDSKRVWGLFGDEDPVVHTFDLFHEHYPKAIHFHGEHRLTEKVLYHYLIPIIRYIDDRQEGRERPTVFIHYDTMHDSYGKPTSSLMKAYEYLLPMYDVYAVAECTTNNPEHLAEVQRWVENTLSAPSWGRLVLTNRPQQLMGDYLIAKQKIDGFIGTTVEFGSDEFKTWEEIIVFFSRLGGQ